jgi:hypothetical protein
MRGLVLWYFCESPSPHLLVLEASSAHMLSGEGQEHVSIQIVIIDARLSKARIPRPSIRLCLAESEITSNVSSYFGLIDH